MEAPLPTSEEEIVAECERAMQLAPAAFPATLPPFSEKSDAPGWYDFEHQAWQVGDRMRRTLVDYKGLRKSEKIVAKIAEAATHRNLRRGRQSFILALGFVNAKAYASKLAVFLGDADVDGQVVSTLLKMRAPGFHAAVSPLVASKKAWIRQLAKKYVERYPPPA